VVAQIDCRKDTREVLEMTIAEDLRSSLKRISDAKNLYIFHSYVESKLYVSLVNEKRHEGDELVQECPLWLGMVGDLLFYSLVLGKENMEGH
jgi:hypothetical protein